MSRIKISHAEKPKFIRFCVFVLYSVKLAYCSVDPFANMLSVGLVLIFYLSYISHNCITIFAAGIRETYFIKS